MPNSIHFKSVFSSVAVVVLTPNASTMLIAWCVGISSTLVLAMAELTGSLWLMALVLLLSIILPNCFKPLSAFALGFIWACWSFSQFIEQGLPSEFEGINLSIIGVVASLPDQNEQRSRFRFLVHEAEGESKANLHLPGHTLQLSCYRCPFQVEPQQRWRLTVRLKRPHGYGSWGAFDYEKYLFRYRVLATGYIRLKSDYELLDQAEFSVNQVRWHIAQELAERMSNDGTAFGMLSALTIGDKTALNTEQRQVFQSTGISHLLAISGLHIGLIFALGNYLFAALLNLFSRIYRWRPRQQIVLAPSLLLAFGYAALAGFAVSTQRALVMLCVYSLCRLFARQVSLTKVLLIAASLILLFDPFSILDAGFWLSCGAVLVIAFASDGRQVMSLLRLQPLIWLGMIPLTAQLFGQVSLISPFINLLMVPLFCALLIPAVFATGLLVMVGEGYLSPYFLQALQWSFDLIYQFLFWTSQLSFANWYLPELDHWDGLAMVLLVLSYAARSYLPYKLHWAAFLPMLLMVALVFATSSNEIKKGEIEITMLDVGQGLSMVIQTQNSVTVYDTGPAYSSGFSASKAVLIPYLGSRGIRQIDTLIISHADNDHIGGYDSLIQAYPVARQLSSRPDRLLQAEPCRAGQHWQIDDITFEILSPDNLTPTGSNDSSCVLRVSNKRTSALITGDISKYVERNLLASKQDLRADILLLPHHGSKTSSSGEFIDRVAPKLGLIAAGYRNRYGHPHIDVVQRYKQRKIGLASTISDGSVRVKIDEHGWSKQAFRQDRQRFWRD